MQNADFLIRHFPVFERKKELRQTKSTWDNRAAYIASLIKSKSRLNC